MDVAILKTINLSKFFYGVKALNQVNVNAKENQITLIIGPNGSGKTTLINTISGFYKADEGKIIFNNQDITNKSPDKICKLGLIRTFQIPQPLKKLTVLENLLIAEDNLGEKILQSLKNSWIKREEEATEKAFRILEFLTLDHLWNIEAYKLSGGQLKLLEVGRALMRNAKMILMDEPIAGVNPVLAHSILEKIVKLKREGFSFLLIEHKLDIVLNYVDYIYVMAAGKVIAEGDKEAVLSNPEVEEVYLSASR